MPMRLIYKFVREESFSGFILMVAAILAMIVANSRLYPGYHDFLTGQILGGDSVRYWIDHALMAIFFLVVGLEIKREIYEGELNSKQKALLPGIAALGGMIVPGIIFIVVNWHQALYWQAWPVPMATDIAFSLAVLQLLGKRVPFTLKLFLLALATFDDLGAVIIIAVFYTHTIHWLFLLAVAIACGILLLGNYLQFRYAWFYLLGGVIVWWCLSKSGVDAAVAGVLVAFTVPLYAKNTSPAKILENSLHPWVNFLILPLFAFTNAGVNFDGFHAKHFLNSLTLGIALALWLGKPMGILSACFLAVKLRLAKLPDHIEWRQMLGVSLLCGIGFTMSLLLAELAFGQAQFSALIDARVGILLGSLLSAVFGYCCFRYTSRP